MSIWINPMVDLSEIINVIIYVNASFITYTLCSSRIRAGTSQNRWCNIDRSQHFRGNHRDARIQKVRAGCAMIVIVAIHRTGVQCNGYIILLNEISSWYHLIRIFTREKPPMSIFEGRYWGKAEWNLSPHSEFWDPYSHSPRWPWKADKSFIGQNHSKSISNNFLTAFGNKPFRLSSKKPPLFTIILWSTFWYPSKTWHYHSTLKMRM
jgi:hypothetical protein